MRSNRLQGTNSKLSKMQNQSLVLNLIQQKGSISRKEIAELTDLTPATITNITTTLINQGLIIEAGKDSKTKKSGRKPILLEINNEKYKILSIYIGRQMIQGGVSNLSGTLLYKKEIRKNIINQGKEVFEKELIDFIEFLILENNLNKDQILGIGVSAPGPINNQTGVFLQFSDNSRMNMGPVPFDWREIPVKEIIQNKFQLKVFADNEANVLALAERWFGAGIGIENFVTYSIGIGVGSGVIIEGMLYRGEDDVVSEIGHITIDYNGKECICGNIGCLEHYASFETMVRKYYEITNSEKLNLLDQKDYNILSDIEDIFTKAQTGDSTAVDVIKEITGFLSIGAISLANIYSPELIILSGNDGGDINFNIFVEPIQKSLKKRAFSVIADKVEVSSSTLGKFNHLYGGVALVLQECFSKLERL